MPKHFKFLHFLLKNMALSYQKYGFGIRNKPIPDPGHRIPDPDPQHFFFSGRTLKTTLTCWKRMRGRKRSMHTRDNDWHKQAGISVVFPNFFLTYQNS
jgi:hypothetical protein